MILSISKKIFLIAFLFFFMCVTPFLIVNKKAAVPKTIQRIGKVDKVKNKDEPLKSQQDKFKILDTSTEKILEMDVHDFLYGAVAYELSPNFHEETLKAQTVATYTYFCRARENQALNPSDDLKGAHFKANLSNDEFYISSQRMKEKWKDSYDKNFGIIKNAVDQVAGEKIVYNDATIFAAYHAISGGTTECCKDVFTEDLAYLTSVPSPQDTFAPGYKTKKEVSVNEFQSLLKNINSNMDFSPDSSSWVQQIEKTYSGKVKSVNICGTSFTGDQLRNAFSLRSSNFSIEFQENNFVFTVLGHGHGVGMSQYGAEYMARQGASYKEILKWYYKDTNIVK